MPLEKGYCIFSGIKFKNTSFNHDGSQFFLAVSVHKYDSQPHPRLNLPYPSHPKVFGAKISPPILVNSRKINSKDHQRRQNFKQLFLPFEISILSESLCIRSNRPAYDNFEAQHDDCEDNLETSRNDASVEKSNGHWEAKIGNDIVGLVNYFCA